MGTFLLLVYITLPCSSDSRAALIHIVILHQAEPKRRPCRKRDLFSLLALFRFRAVCTGTGNAHRARESRGSFPGSGACAAARLVPCDFSIAVPNQKCERRERARAATFGLPCTSLCDVDIRIVSAFEI